MVDVTENELAAADACGMIEFETKPHAASAHYDRQTGLLTLSLYNGCSFSFPPRQLQGLESATDDELAQVELSFTGYGVHWDTLDADFTVPGLLAGSFGTARFMEGHRAKLRSIYQNLLERGTDVEAQAAE